MRLCERRDAAHFAARRLRGAAPRRGFAEAETIPRGRCKIIVPFGAGGPTDVFTRAIAEELHKALHQSFVMENGPAPAPRSAPTRSRKRRPTATRC